MSWLKKFLGGTSEQERLIALYGEEYYNRHSRDLKWLQPILDNYLGQYQAAMGKSEQPIRQIQKLIRPIWEPEDVIPNSQAVWNFYVDKECLRLFYESLGILGPHHIPLLLGYESIGWMSSFQPHTLILELSARVLTQYPSLVEKCHGLLEVMISEPESFQGGMMVPPFSRGIHRYRFNIVHVLTDMSMPANKYWPDKKPDVWAKRKLENLPASYLSGPVAGEVSLCLMSLRAAEEKAEEDRRRAARGW